MTYRKYKGSLYWHFHPECPYWPEADYRETSYVELYDRLCPDCIHLGSK